MLSRQASAATLLSATPIAGAPAGAHAFAVRYRSIGFDGRPARITGLLIEPAGAPPRGGRPVVAWAHGTTGISEACAPSGAAGRFAQIAGLDAMLRRGWVVVATDYAGLGSPGPHPYLVADATARAVIDSVRAARDHGAAGPRFAVWGLSQGGHAALVSGERARALAPELTLVGTAAAAPPTDLRANFGAKSKPTTRGVLIAFASASWAQVYDAPLATLGRPHTVRLIERLARICALGQGAKLGTMLGAVALGRQVRNVDLANMDPWRGLLARNSADPRGVAGPLLIAQSEADEVVSAPVTRAYAHVACRAGAHVRWLGEASGDHGGTAARAAGTTVDWLADRFAGRVAPSDCERL